MIAFPCPKCKKTLKAPEEKAGAKTVCAYCRCPVQVPSPNQPSAKDSTDTPPKATSQVPDWIDDLSQMPDANKLLEVLPAPTSPVKPAPRPVIRSSGRVQLKGLGASAFQHPLDKHATNALKAIKGFDWLAAKFLEYGFERIQYATNISSNIRVGPKQLPKLYNMMLECCSILDMPEPELYVAQGGVNAHTSGHTNPYIVIETGLLNVMDESEVMGVIAHELGHIKCGHVLYWTMANMAAPLFAMLGEMTMGIGKIVGKGIVGALLAWQSKSEFSADRAALLVMQNARPCISMLMKLSGGNSGWGEQLDVAQFLKQARAYHEGMDQSLLDRMYRALSAMGTTHPACVERARHLDEWAVCSEYKDIIAGRVPDTTALTNMQLCPGCGHQVETGVKFCPHCTTPLRG